MTTASEKTIARLTGALSRHDVGDLLPALAAQLEAGLSQTAASAMIELVEALPLTEVAARAKANRVTEVGYYSHPADGRTVKVQRSKKGYLYALELDGPKPRFVSGLISELDATLVAEKPAPVVASESASTAALTELLEQLKQRTA